MGKAGPTAWPLTSQTASATLSPGWRTTLSSKTGSLGTHFSQPRWILRQQHGHHGTAEEEGDDPDWVALAPGDSTLAAQALNPMVPPWQKQGHNNQQEKSAKLLWIL